MPNQIRTGPFLILAAMLASCSGATPTVTNVPTAMETATALPAAAATAKSAATPMPIATTLVIPTTTTDDLVPASQLSDTVQARLRLAHLVAGGPNVDLYINGAPATNGRMSQANLPPGYVSGYIYLQPGTYHVAVVPAGQGLDHPFLSPLDVTVAAAHHYTLALMGQKFETDRKPLIIDETAAELKAGAVATDSTRLYVANLAGGAGMEFTGGGRSDKTDVPYGQFAATIYPAGNFQYHVALKGNPGDESANFPNDDGYWNVPATSTLVGFVGANPDEQDFFTAAPLSDLTTIDFLQSFSGKQLKMEEPISFDTLLVAINTTGLAGTLNTGSPYVFFAPTDQAFAALPQDKLTALLADPKALSNVLRNLIVPGYYPVGSLSSSPTGAFERSVTNLLGAKLVIGADFTINGTATGALRSVFVDNGSQVHPISKLLLPTSN